MTQNIKFYPTKRLFIKTLTQDITIHDCILDLMDNAVDAYVKNDLHERRKIELSFNKSKFEIYDNCGGITLTDLIEHVFRLGYVNPEQNYKGIGIYGIGLKRSIFKLGNNIFFETDDGRQYNKFTFSVNKWAEDPDSWELPIEISLGSKLKRGEKPYTRLIITELYPETKDAFTVKFQDDFKKTTQIYYTLFIQNNIDIIINEEKQKHFEISIITPIGFQPAIYKEKYSDILITIICWIEPTLVSRLKKTKGHIGWNIFMNNRLILSDDVSETTGWTGSRAELPKFHSIYNEFRGIVLLETNNPHKLPINTSKNGFNQESAAYIKIKNLMSNTARPLIDYLSKKYKVSKSRIEEQTDILEDTIEAAAESTKTTALALHNIPRKSAFRHPPLKTSTTTQMTTITFQTEKNKVDTIKKIIKVKSNWDVGVKSFDYYYKVITSRGENE
ncbi:MAG: ATP-binding protein [Candidatus Zixiibacteriota bacterium]